MSQHQVRIISGKYRGKKMAVIDSPSLRPTGDRIRETLFNWLQFDIAKHHTLDLFAGSGILSFEAISRGAKAATLVEKEKRVISTMKTSCEFMKGEPLRFYHQDAKSFIKKQDLKLYSLIFIDPPFQSSLLDQILIMLREKVSDNCILYIETAQKLTPETYQLSVIREQKAGQVYFGLYQFETSFEK